MVWAVLLSWVFGHGVTDQAVDSLLANGFTNDRTDGCECIYTPAGDQITLTFEEV
jgi:hypothetical protein